jgi:hypothetical protein
MARKPKGTGSERGNGNHSGADDGGTTHACTPTIIK